ANRLGTNHRSKTVSRERQNTTKNRLTNATTNRGTCKGSNKRKPKAQFSLVQKQMQDCLIQLGINLVVVWNPDNSKSVHGEIKGNVIFLYDSEKDEAWSTFTHEVTEYKLQAVTRPYRILINNLLLLFKTAIFFTNRNSRRASTGYYHIC